MGAVVNALVLSIALEGIEPAERLEDLYQFPNQQAVRQALAFNWNLQNNILARYTGHTQRDQELDAIFAETQQLYHAWDLLDDALWEQSPLETRLASLKSLHLLLGEEAYRRGLMPSSAPIWRFTSID
jgi:hypothetical protein